MASLTVQCMALSSFTAHVITILSEWGKKHLRPCEGGGGDHLRTGHLLSPSLGQNWVSNLSNNCACLRRYARSRQSTGKMSDTKARRCTCKDVSPGSWKCLCGIQSSRWGSMSSRNEVLQTALCYSHASLVRVCPGTK